MQNLTLNTSIVADYLATNGNTAKFTKEQKAELVMTISSHYGLNPALMPFNFINFQGQEKLYLTKVGCDQIAKNLNLTREIVSKDLDKETLILTITAKVSDKERSETASASIFLGSYNTKGELVKLKGNDLANSLMKCESKAKRRATLAFIGFQFEEDSVENYDKETEKVKAGETMTKEIIKEALVTEREVVYYDNNNINHKQLLNSLIIDIFGTDWRSDVSLLNKIKEFVQYRDIDLTQLKQKLQDYLFNNEVKNETNEKIYA